MPCLLLGHDCNCDLDAYVTHHLSNVSLSPSQQDRSDLMKARGFDTGSAYESDVSVSNIRFSVRVSFGSASAYESVLSPSTLHCSGSDPGSTYGSDILFLAEIAVDEYAHGFGPRTSTTLPLSLSCVLDSTGHLGTTKPSFDCKTAHEPDVPQWTHTPVETESAHDDVLDSTDTVCLPSEPGPAYAPDLPCSKEIPFQPETAYGFENPSSTDNVCLWSETETAYGSDILDSTDTACLPCEPGHAQCHASDVSHTTDIPVESESACGSDFHFSAEISFDTRFTNGADVPYPTKISFDTCSAYETDLASSTEIPGRTRSAHGSDLSFSNEAQIVFDHGSAYGSAIHFSKKTVSLMFGFRSDSAYESVIPFSAEIPSDTTAAYESDVPCLDSISFCAILLSPVPLTKQPTCSRFALISGSPFQNYVKDVHTGQLHYNVVLMSYTGLTLACTSKSILLAAGHEESYNSESSSGRSKVKDQLPDSQEQFVPGPSVNGNTVGSSQQYADDVVTILKQSHVRHQFFSVCNSDSTSYADCETATCDDESTPSFSLAVEHDALELTEESYNSVSSPCRSKVRDPPSSQLAACINGNHDIVGLFQSHSDDAETSNCLKWSRVSYTTDHRVCNDSILVCDFESAFCAVYATVPCSDETQSPFSLSVGHDSSLDHSPVTDKQTCDQLAPINGGLSQRRVDGAQTSCKQSYCDLGEGCNFDNSSGRLQITDTCSQFTTWINDNPAGPSQSHGEGGQTSLKQSHLSYASVHMSLNESIPAWDSTTFFTVCKSAYSRWRDSLGLIEESYSSESSSNRSRVRESDQLTCNHLVPTSGGPAQSHGAETSSKQPYCDLFHMSSIVSNTVSTIKSSEFATCALCEPTPCDDESVQSFALAVGHDCSELMEERYNSESYSHRSQVKDHPMCSKFAASIEGPFDSNGDDAQVSLKQSHDVVSNDTLHMDHNVLITVCKTESTQGRVYGWSDRRRSSQLVNRTHRDVSDVGGVPKTSESDETVDTSCSKPEHEEHILMFDTGFEIPCAVHWIIIVFNLLRCYCCPKKLEERPECPRTRSEELLEAPDVKRNLSCVSTRLRRCVAPAKIRKRLRAWRMDTKNEKYDRIGHVVGVAFLLIVIFQPVAEGSAVVAVTSLRTNMTQYHNETALVNASNVHTDMNQLAALNADLDLKELIGSLAMELREVKSRMDIMESINVDLQRENAEMKGTIAELHNENDEIKSDNVEMRTENVQIKAENVKIRKENAEVKNEIAEIQVDNTHLKKRTAVLELKTREENAEMKSVVSAIEGEITIMKIVNADSQMKNSWMRNENAQIKAENVDIKREVMRLKQTMHDASNIKRRGPCTPKCDFLTDLGFWHRWNRLDETIPTVCGSRVVATY
eukprot:SAG11_NODE_556_length_8552_cov_8.500651_2_plen_1378_part_00